MTPEPGTLIRRYFDELLNGKNHGAAAEILSSDCVLWAPMIPDGIQGIAAVSEVIRSLPRSFSELHFTVEHEVAEPGVAAASWTMRGTHCGEWLGVPATGRAVSMSGVDFFFVEAGKIRRIEIQADYLGALRQLGAIQ